MGYPYRCRHCQTRHTFKQTYDWYIRKPKCRQCGKSNFRLDKWMLNRDTKKMGCSCTGYPFYHRQGSLFCWYRTDGTGRYPGDSDFRDRYSEDVADYDDSNIRVEELLDDILFDVNIVPDYHGEAIVPF